MWFFISVNAETASNHAIDQNANTPNFLQTMNALKCRNRRIPRKWPSNSGRVQTAGATT